MAASLVLPRGSVQSTTFQRWWDTRGDWVEAPNQRRDGESGVQRIRPRDPAQEALYCKRQVGHLYRSLLHPFGRPTVLREQRALDAFATLGLRVPRMVYCAAQQSAEQWRALLVTEELHGFISLEQWYRDDCRQHWGEAIHRQMLEQVAETLARFHRARWQHGCCYPKHLFIRVHADQGCRVEVAVLDLEKSRRRLRAADAARHDLRQLNRHRDGMPDEDWSLFQAAYRQCFTPLNKAIQNAVPFTTP